LRIFFILFFIITSPFIALAQKAYSIKGIVTDAAGEKLPGATVFVHELNTGSVTDLDGYFEIKNVKPGTYHLHIQYTGFETVSDLFKVTSEDVTFNILLKPTSLELKAVVIEESTLKIDKEKQSLSVEVADQGFIQKNRSTNFVRTMEKLPGINAITTGTGIAKPVIRGQSFNRIAVTENGIKQEGQQWGADHGLEIDQYNVERVEVIKGPASLIYGSDAMGGVINIRPPAPPENNSYSASALLTGASNNDLIGSSVMASANKNGNFFRIRASLQDYADYKVPADSFVYNSFRLPLHNQRLKNTAGADKSASATVGLNRNWGHTSLTLSAFDQKNGLFPGAYGIPRAYELADDNNNRNIDLPYQKTTHYKIISNSNILFRKHWLEFEAGFQQNHRQEFSLPHAHGTEAPPGDNLELDLLLNTYSSNIRYHISKSDKFRHVIGVSGQVQENSRGGFQFLLPEFTTSTMGAFYFQKVSFKKVFINAGIRYDLGTYEIKEQMLMSAENNGFQLQLLPSGFNRTFSNWSGSAGISYLPKESLNFKFNLGSSFRMPAPYELSANGIHHGAFRHEMGDSKLESERGYLADFAAIYHSEHFMVSVNPFFNYYDNYIFLSPSARFSPLPEAGQLYHYMQTRAMITGSELTADFHLTKRFHCGVLGEMVYAVDLINSYSLPFTPPPSLTLEAEYEIETIKNRFYKSFINFNTKFFSAQNLTARNEPVTPGYTLLNFSFGTEIKMKEQNLRLIFHVYNITDKKYLNHLSRYRILNLPEPGRNFQLTLIIPFKKTLIKKQT
jgi:iron complex outermembrane recepter protein